MFEELRDEILQCRCCSETFGFEPHPIVSGCANSRIVQISQAPSQNVHITHRPFNDKSGEKLRKEWYVVTDEQFYDIHNFYITSIAHCYPGKSPGGGDRLPPKCCAEKWLRKELEVVDNSLYLLIGGKAAHFFFPKEDFSKLVFQDRMINEKPAYILPHPSPLNVKWFKDHPEFLTVRLPIIRSAIHSVLGI